MAYNIMKSNATFSRTVILTKRKMAHNTEYTLTESIKNFDFIEILFSGSSSELYHYEEFLPVVNIPVGASAVNFLAGRVYGTSSNYVNYQVGFKANTTFISFHLSANPSTAVLYIRINGIKILPHS